MGFQIFLDDGRLRAQKEIPYRLVLKADAFSASHVQDTTDVVVEDLKHPFINDSPSRDQRGLGRADPVWHIQTTPGCGSLQSFTGVMMNLVVDVQLGYSTPLLILYQTS